MTKKQAISEFRLLVLPIIRSTYEKDGKVDHSARSQAWADFTDGLMKDRQITAYQDRTWSNPY